MASLADFSKARGSRIRIAVMPNGGRWMMAILIDIPQIAYKTWAIEIHTGDWMRDREMERNLAESMAMRKYPYRADHDHVR